MTFSPRQRLLAYAMAGVGLGTNAMILFLVPLYAVDKGVSLGVVGLLLGSKALTESVMGVPLGGFIDRYGPKRAYLIGSVGFSVVAFTFGFVSFVPLMFVLMVLLGVFRGLAWVSGQAYASSMREGADRNHDVARFAFAANIGQMASPILVGFSAQIWGYPAAFVVMAIYGLCCFLAASTLPAVNVGEAGGSADGSGFRAARGLLKLPGIQVVLFITFCRLWLPTAWMAFLPLFLVQSGSSEGVAGTAASAMAISSALISLVTGRMAQVIPPAPLTALSLAVSCVGVAVTPWMASVPAVYLPAILVGIGQGVSLPMLIVLTSQAAPAGQKSLALGLRSGVNQAAATGAPVLVGPLIAVASLSVGFVASGVLGLVFLAAGMVVYRRGRDLSLDDATEPA